MDNIVILIGRLTRDAEIRMTTTGKKVASFTLAVNGYGDNVDFIDVETWEGRAGVIEKYTSKGSLIGIKGSIKRRDYTDKNGNNARYVYVNADSIRLLDSKKQSQKQPEEVSEDTQTFDIMEEDIQF